MLAYLIIGSELIILYFVFWVVFLREPKPREIRAELWGRYQEVSENALNSDSQYTLPLFTKTKRITAFLPSRLRARFYRMARMRKREHHHFKPQFSSACHKKRIISNKWAGQIVASKMRQETNREIAEKLLLLLNKTLNKFSVKIPH